MKRDGKGVGKSETVGVGGVRGMGSMEGGVVFGVGSRARRSLRDGGRKEREVEYRNVVGRRERRKDERRTETKEQAD